MAATIGLAQALKIIGGAFGLVFYVIATSHYSNIEFALKTGAVISGISGIIFVIIGTPISTWAPVLFGSTALGIGYFVLNREFDDFYLTLMDEDIIPSYYYFRCSLMNHLPGQSSLEKDLSTRVSKDRVIIANTSDLLSETKLDSMASNHVTILKKHGVDIESEEKVKDILEDEFENIQSREEED